MKCQEVVNWILESAKANNGQWPKDTFDLVELISNPDLRSAFKNIILGTMLCYMAKRDPKNDAFVNMHLEYLEARGIIGLSSRR